MKSVYDFLEYKSYLNSKAGIKGARTGVRSGIAVAANCNTTYVSQVLNGDREFNLEQAEKIGHFLGHTSEENHFFLLLVQMNRAGTKTLKEYFQKQIQNILSERMLIRKRLGVSESLSKEQQSIYYSAWYFAAIHVAITIPELQTKEILADYFDLSIAKVSMILDFLSKNGLIKEEKGRYKMGQNHIHLGSDSENIMKHHSNWRLQVMNSLERDNKKDLHLFSRSYYFD